MSGAAISSISLKFGVDWPNTHIKDHINISGVTMGGGGRELEVIL